MKKIRAAIVGYGNIGKYVLEALEAAPDFEVAGIIRRNPNDIPDELKRVRSSVAMAGAWLTQKTQSMTPHCTLATRSR